MPLKSGHEEVWRPDQVRNTLQPPIIFTLKKTVMDICFVRQEEGGPTRCSSNLNLKGPEPGEMARVILGYESYLASRLRVSRWLPTGSR